MQRACTLIGAMPLALVGCVAPERVATATTIAPPPANYALAVPVPPPAPPPPEAPSSVRTGIAQLTNNFAGTVGVAVHSIDDGWTVSHNGNRPMPQQSVSKLWVAMTALDAVDEGRITMDDVVVIRREDLTLFHQPIATLVAQKGEYRATVRELMRRAMTMSDNTANDSVLRHVGGPQAVRAFLERRAINNIRFGPGERLLQSKTAGLSWRQDYAMGRAFYEARARLPQSVRVTAFNAYVADPPDGAGAIAIADALARLSRGRLLKPESTKWLLDTMAASRTGHARLRAAMPAGWTLAHKTGTGQDLLSRTAGFNDIGLLTAPDGKRYSIAVLIGDTSRPVRERQELMQNVVRTVVAASRKASPAG